MYCSAVTVLLVHVYFFSWSLLWRRLVNGLMPCLDGRSRCDFHFGLVRSIVVNRGGRQALHAVGRWMGPQTEEALGLQCLSSHRCVEYLAASAVKSRGNGNRASVIDGSLDICCVGKATPCAVRSPPSVMPARQPSHVRATTLMRRWLASIDDYCKML